MTLLDDFIEGTQANLPGQDPPELRPPVNPPTRLAPACSHQDEEYLIKWRAALNDELRARATKRLMATYDRKNLGRGWKGSSPAFQAMRVSFEARVRDASQATLFEMLNWATPEDKSFVFQAFEAVADQFMLAIPSPQRPDTPRPRQ